MEIHEQCVFSTKRSHWHHRGHDEVEVFNCLYFGCPHVRYGRTREPQRPDPLNETMRSALQLFDTEDPDQDEPRQIGPGEPWPNDFY